MNTIGLRLVAVTLLVLGLAAPAAAREKAKVTLSPTGVAAAAKGKATISVRSASDGRFDVTVQRLARATSYDLLVGGVKVHTLVTNGGGRAKVRFSSNPRSSHDVALGFDPRGATIEVRAGGGQNVLVGTLPASGGDDAGDVTCCIPDDSGPECEDRTAAECAAQGGTQVAATSCLPNPCGDTTTGDHDVVCCVPDDSGPQCEDRTQAECLAAGGSVVEATSCDPNPCAGTPPPADDHVQCCIPAYYVWACEDRTVAECAQLGGIGKGAGVCSPTSCNMPPPPDHGICCLPNAAGDEIECEDRDPRVCVAAGGTVKTTESGVCEVDTCADVVPPNPDVMCCVPNAGGDESECEDLSAAACTAAGGVSHGPGVCAPDTCGPVEPPQPDIQCCEEHSHELECRARTATECAANGGVNVGDGACGPNSCDGL